MAHPITVGTAGWSYSHWNGLVYPRSAGPGFHPLELMSRHLDTVEINSSFYQPLKPELTKLWIRKVANNTEFAFTAKLHQNFTHRRSLDAAEIAAFKDGLWPLLRAGKFGALLLQFPWSFRFTGENRDHLIRLRRAFHEFPLVAEMRHDSWMAEEALGTFLDYKIGFCNVDQPQYTRAMPPTAILTSNLGYVRMHGRNPKNALGAFDPLAQRMRQHDYLYSDAEIAEWAGRAKNIGRFADRVFVIFNNDAGAKSFVNALQMRSATVGTLRGVPPMGLRRQYPVELEPFGPGHAQQELLFPAA